MSLLPTVSKVEVRDLLPDLKLDGWLRAGQGRRVTFDSTGTGYVITDNDGVDDSNGETLFWSIGKL